MQWKIVVVNPTGLCGLEIESVDGISLSSIIVGCIDSIFDIYADTCSVGWILIKCCVEIYCKGSKKYISWYSEHGCKWDIQWWSVTCKKDLG